MIFKDAGIFFEWLFFICYYMIPQLLNAFGQFLFSCIIRHYKAKVTAHKIHFYLFHALALQKFIYGKCAIGAAHTL